MTKKDIQELVDSIEDYDEGAGWICRADDVLKVINTIRIKWLRSEIEKLEGIKKTLVDEYDTFTDKQIGYNTAITTLITRYKEELLELEKGV